MQDASRARIRPCGLLMFVAAAGFVATTATALGDEGEEGRLSVTAQATSAQREAGVAGVVTRDEFAPLVRAGKRTKTWAPHVTSKPGVAASASPNIDFWFYMADVVLFNDHDQDGYFNGIDLLFDADTYYDSAQVYAVVYLSFEGGPWNEYAETDDFIISGATGDDEYNIVTELVSGYPSGSYDLLIELYDAWDDSFVAWIGPDETSELAFLQLEDERRDTPEVPEVVVVEEGGGSLGWGTLLLLTLAAVVRRQGPVAGRGGIGTASRRAVRMTLRPQADRLSK
jgi:hypothetical protein